MLLTSFPAAIVTIFPDLAIRLATTAAADAVQPSAPPRDKVRMSCPSSTPRNSASTMTVVPCQQLFCFQRSKNSLTIIFYESIAAKDAIRGQSGIRCHTKDVKRVPWVSTNDSLYKHVMEG